MRIIEIIEKKKRGEELSNAEIESFVQGYVDDTIPDYQAAALLMAVWFQGMSARETAALTLAMAASGDMVDLSSLHRVTVDKHSTGGVADTTTLVAVPLVAACGGSVAKMSGRGLGHTGGTLDKLESIPGLSVSQPMERFLEIVSSCGMSVIGQTGKLVPADKKIYALRDVTGTIDNYSLIASSIMSKKLASGADAIVLDVKTGSGAFMKELESAVSLARTMVEIGRHAGRRTVALVTDMNQPLGLAVGNALEVTEAIEILRGDRKGDLREVSFAIAAEMLLVSGIAREQGQATALIAEALESGEAIEHFACMIEAQGGNPEVVRDLSILPRAERIVPVGASQSGVVDAIDTAEIGACAQLLGAGRARKEDVIDPAVGIWMHCRLGATLAQGDCIAELHVNAISDAKLEEVRQRLVSAVDVGAGGGRERKLIYERIDSLELPETGGVGTTDVRGGTVTVHSRGGSSVGETGRADSDTRDR